MTKKPPRKRHVIYACARMRGDDYLIIAVGDDGNLLGEHISSSLDWSKYDIGLTSNRKHDQYDAHFGTGNWRLEWVQNERKHPKFAAVLEQLRRNWQRCRDEKITALRFP